VTTVRLVVFAAASVLFASARAAARPDAPPQESPNAPKTEADGRKGGVEGPRDLADLDSYAVALRHGQLGRDTSEALDDYLADFPSSPRAHALRAELRRRKGRYDEAEKDLAAARAAPIADAATRVEVACVAYALHLQRGAVEACAADLDAALPTGDGADLLDRVYAPIHGRRVELLAATGRRKDAYSCFTKFFKDSTQRTEPGSYVEEMGRALLALRDFEAAARALVPVEKKWRDLHDARQGEVLVLLARTYRLAHDGGDAFSALDALKDALALDRSDGDAHVERARTRIFRFENDPADESVSAALGVDPRNADALAVRAQLLLMDQRVSDGLAAADQALAENPRHADALAAKVAALDLLGRHEEGRQAFARLLELAPEDGEPFCLVADVMQYLYRFRDAIPTYRRALQLDPAWTRSYVGLARCLVNTGDLKGALEQLQEFRRRDQVRYALADNVALALDRLSSFVEVRRGTFTYHVHPVESPLLVPFLDEVYAKAWPDLCARYGFDPATPVRVEVFPHHEDFSARTVGFTGFGALGVCFGDVFTLLSPESELRGNFAFDVVAVHELTHVVTLGLSKNKVPRWLTEGISVHEEHVFSPGSARTMDRELFDYFASGEVVPVRELNRLFGGPKILFGYYEGGLLADFLVEKRGEKVLTEMLRRFAADEETPTVVEHVLGMSCEELDRDFQAWLVKTKVGGMKVQPNYTEGGRERLLAKLRAAPEGAPPDAALLAQVAWAYHQEQRAVDRDDHLQHALAADPKLPAAHFLLAERALGGAKPDRATARRELETGFANGGDEFSAWMRYAELLAREAKVLASKPDARAPAMRGRPHGGAKSDDEEDEAPADLTAEQKAACEKLLEVLAHAKACFPRFVGPSNPYLLRAKLLRDLGRMDDALVELREYCAIHDTAIPARRILVDRALERKDFAEAKRFLLELRAIDPFHRATWRELAQCEKELGAPADAIRLLERALVIDPSTEADYDPARAALPHDEVEERTRAELLLDLAALRLDVGEKAGAERALDEARQLAPNAERLEELARRAQATDGR
jgi:tetratricopeptide (TPR) repeat protein